MPAVGDRYWIAYYAARGGNWALARYQLRHLAMLLRRGAVTRPKHAANLLKYERDSLGPLMDAIQARDFAAFASSYERATAGGQSAPCASSATRISSGGSQTSPPEQLDLGPQAEAGPKPSKDPQGA